MGFSGFNATQINNNLGHGNLKNAQIALFVRSIYPKEMLMIVYFQIWSVFNALRTDFTAQMVLWHCAIAQLRTLEETLVSTLF